MEQNKNYDRLKRYDPTIPLIINSDGYVSQSHYAGNDALLAEVHITKENYHDESIWPEIMRKLLIRQKAEDEVAEIGNLYLDCPQWPAFDKEKYPVMLHMDIFFGIEPDMTFYIFKGPASTLPTIAISIGQDYAPAKVETSGKLTEEPQPTEV